MTDLQLISLFDGIAGFPLAFSRAGVKTVATVEIDKAAAGVAAEHFPDADHFADVTEVTADDFLALGIDPGRTVVSAGWPCTDLSLAGLRLGLGGARSGLVGEVFRLLLSLRPRWVVLENVPGLLSSVCPCPGGGICGDTCEAPHPVRGGACGRTVRRGRATGAGRCMALHGGGMGTVLRRLGECGYGLAYRVLDAQYFGVPQRRRRVVIVGCLGDAAGAAEVLLEPEGGGRHPAASAAARARTARRASLASAGAGRPGPVVNALTAKDGRRGVGGVDENTAQGGHLVASTLTAREGKGPDSDATTTLIVPSVTAKWATGSGGPSGDETQNLVVPVDLAQVTSAANRSNPQPGDPSPTLASGGRAAVALGGQTTHALTAEGADASEDGTGRGTPVIAFGHTNGMDPQAAEHVTPTLRAGRTSAAGQAAMESAGVRRLMPVECERLQGFPDGWTAVSAGKPQADSARYRQLGNSVAVPVFTWVADGLVTVDEVLSREPIDTLPEAVIR